MGSSFRDIFCELLCSSCRKYLSVPPVKVYANRQIKCGRCCEDDDGGTKSLLYEMVIKDLKFPCINHMEGCIEYLPISEMSTHEYQCIGKKYYCPACLTFEGSSYEMYLHITEKHEELILSDKCLLIEINKSTEEKSVRNINFYCNHKFLLFIIVKYKLNSICVDLKVAQSSNKDICYKYSLFSMGNKLLYKTKVIKCTDWGVIDGNGVFIDLGLLKVDNIMSCQFDVCFNSAMLLPFNKCPTLMNSSTDCNMPSILDPSASSGILRCKFENISEIELNKYVYSSATYYVMDIPWKIFIQKECENNIYYLRCYLEKTESKIDCSVLRTFTLVSKFKEKNVSYESKIDYKDANLVWGPKQFAKWDFVIDPQNGFVIDDSIKIEIEILTIELIKEWSCTTCQDAGMICRAGKDK